MATVTAVTLAVSKLLSSSSPKLTQPFSLLYPHRKPTFLFSSSSFAPLRHRSLTQPCQFSVVPKIFATISIGDELSDAE